MKANQKAENKKPAKHKTKVIQLNAFRQPGQVETDKLIGGLWNVAQAALWNNEDFSSKEKETFKKLIAVHFYNGKSGKQNFTDLVERICLAKRYVQRRNGRYISKPQDWLNVHYSLGLAGTRVWLEQVNKIRANVPDYNKGITTLANGLLKFIETGSDQTFHKYRKSLIEQKQFDLLQIFGNTIINLQYGI